MSIIKKSFKLFAKTLLVLVIVAFNIIALSFIVYLCYTSSLWYLLILLIQVYVNSLLVAVIKIETEIEKEASIFRTWADSVDERFYGNIENKEPSDNVRNFENKLKVNEDER